MSSRRLPVRPNLEQLKHQARDLLRAIRAGEPAAVAELRRHHPEAIAPAAAKLADAQLVLARSYQASSWWRLTQAALLVEAIWRDDAESVRTLITANPRLLREDVLIRRDSNWGPPMTYAANLGRDGIVRLLHDMGATDHESAIGRAALQGQTATVHLVYQLAGAPPMERMSLAGPAYTLSIEGTATLFALGLRIDEAVGVDTSSIEHLLGTDSRNPAAKHRILEMWIEHGFTPPDTPAMALHRGRIDLLETHLAHDPQLLQRTFDVTEIYPLAPACSREPYRAQGTPLQGTTLLHMAAYWDELDTGAWLLDQGADPDVPAAITADGIGGYTALFSTAVSQRNFWVNHGRGQPDEARFTRLLLDRGADPNRRATIRQGLEEGHGGGPLRDYADVTPLGWGHCFHPPIFVSQESLRMIEAAGGRE